MLLNLMLLNAYKFIHSLFRNELAKVATRGEFLVAKEEVLVALATVLVAISSPVK